MKSIKVTAVLDGSTHSTTYNVSAEMRDKYSDEELLLKAVESLKLAMERELELKERSKATN